MEKIKSILFLALLVLACPMRAANISEYAVKAAYLSNFTEFVKWPKSSFADKESPIVVGVLGEDPFGKTLDEAVKGKTSGGRPLAVKRFNSFEKERLEDIRNCQVLFIANSEQSNIREILADLEGSHLLTVSEISRFPMLGGMIQFVQEGDNISLVFNPKTAIRAKLKPSSQLMMASKLYMDVDSEKVKTLYYAGIQLYISGELKEAIAKWKECLAEDPGYLAAQDKIKQARAKLRAISKIR